MSYTDIVELENCFDALWELIAEEQKKLNIEVVSFGSGIIDEEEGFKHKYAEDIPKHTAVIRQGGEELIGSGKIKEAVFSAFSKCSSTLVDSRDVKRFKNIANENLYNAEKALYQIFHAESNEDNEAAFQAAISIWGERFTIISYLFFLKNPEQYAVMRANNFLERFKQIGAPIQCTRHCTWDNYQVFLSVLNQVKDFLETCVNEEISLIDAHSFVWMLRKLKGVDLSKHKNEKLNDFETRVISSSKEGKKVHYYTTKYERKASLRAKAIQIHGTVCKACGFSYAEKYGTIGKNFIEVHHIKPLNTLDEEVVVNPETDMVCLCANCHRMIHRRRNAVLSIEELKEMIRIQDKKRKKVQP